MNRLAALIIIAVAALPAHAANRYCNSGYCAPAVHRDVVQELVTPQYVTNNIFYSVGDSVRQYAPQAVIQAQRAQIARDMQRLQDRMTEFNQYSQQVTQPVCYVPVQSAAVCVPGMPQQPGYQQPQQPEQPPTFNHAQRSTSAVIAAGCLKCHGENGKARDHFDLTRWLTCDEIGRAVSAVAEGRMPQGGQLADPQKAQLYAELFDWNKTNGFKATPPQQPPTEAPREDSQPDADASTRPDFSRFTKYPFVLANQ